MTDYVRKPNVFEKLLLVVGIIAVIVGYGLILKLVLVENILSYDVIIAIFLWLIIILLIVLAAVAENVKEELRYLIIDETEKIKILRSKGQSVK